MKKILIIQNMILHYRKPLYNELSKYYDLTVIHSGIKSITNEDSYNEIIVPKTKIGSIINQRNILKEVRSGNYNTVISMLDLHWVNNIFAFYIKRKETKFIWWGQWLTNKRIPDIIKVYLSKKANNILYTQVAKDSFVERGVCSEKLFVANNTFDVGKRVRCYENKTKSTILFVGSLDKRKQLDVLIKAYCKIKKKLKSDVKLLIIGHGEEGDELKMLVNKLKQTENVLFIGKINDTVKLVSYYKEAIVSVSFGQAGLSVLQSLGYGVPFITKSNAISGGEKSNIVHEKNGFFCEDNQQSLEKYLLKVCNNIDYARLLGENAFQYYSKYCTIENMAQGFIDAIENTQRN